MEIEAPAPLSVAPLSVAPPTPAVPDETENIELNQQPPVEEQPFITSPLHNDGLMLPPGTPAHTANEPLPATNEDPVIIIFFSLR